MQIKSVAKKISYLILAGVIITALIIATNHFIIAPTLEKHRAEIEKLASSLLNEPVTIDKINASWYIYQPVVRLDQVTLFNKETNKPQLQIAKVHVFFSLPQSLWHWRLVPSTIMISGTALKVYQTQNGDYAVQGFPTFGGFNSAPYQSEAKFKDMMNWLSQQPRIILRNIDLRFTPLHAPERFLTLYNLSFDNEGRHHIIVGKAILHQTVPTSLTVALDWRGQSFDLKQIKAKIFLYVTGLSLEQWAKGRALAGWQANKGILSAKIWATWHKGLFHKIQTSFRAYNLNLYSQTDKSLHVINRVSGNLGWRREGENQVFAGDDILIDFADHLWPTTSFYLLASKDSNREYHPKTLTFGYINLEDIQRFLFSSVPILSADWQKTLSDLKLRGNIENASFIFAEPWTNWQSLQGSVTFKQLHIAPWQNLPGLKNFSGKLKWQNQQGTLSFVTKRGSLTYHQLFPQPLAINQLTGDINFNKDASQAWMLQMNNLQLLNSDLAANLSGSISAINTNPSIDMTANFSLQKADHLARYLPSPILNKELDAWLRTAFLRGEIKAGRAIIKGVLKEFPFDNNNGTFNVIGQINNIEMHYAPGWPNMQHINGQLTFNGRRLDIAVVRADFMGIPVENVKASIPYLGDAQPQILEIQPSDIQTDFPRALKFVYASPLAKNLGVMFKGVEFRGPLRLQLGLTMPLANPDAIQVNGKMQLQNTEMNLVPWNLKLRQLNGQVEFTQDTTEAPSIRGLLFNKPFEFSLTTINPAKPNAIVRAQFTNVMAITDLQNWLHIPFEKIVQGQTQVAATIDFSLTNPIAIHLASDLVGVKINLPDQYAKPTDINRDFTADILLKLNQPVRAQFTYGKLLSAAVILNKKANKFNLAAANIHFGTGVAAWPATDGLYISGQFDTLDWDKIKSYTGSPKQDNLAGITLRGIDINAGVVNVLGLQLNKVKLQIKPTTAYWNVNINSTEMQGQLAIPVKFTAQQNMNAQFQRLSIKSGNRQKMSGFKVKNLPSMSLVINNLTYNNMPIGTLRVNTTPSASGLTIRNLQINSSRLDLDASGNWVQSGASDTTNLKGKASSPNVSGLLTSFNLGVHNLVSTDGKLNFDLNWRDAPYAPSIATLSGRASLNLNKGSIVDIGASTEAKMDLGRLLSVFSLQSIPRRLTGDFSDVSGKGYNFNYIRGDFNLQSGNANTQNMQIDGPLAKVDIQGRISFKNKDFDLILQITPYNVTSPLPLAATLINPVIGLAALAVNTVIGSTVSKAVASHRYRVTGPWSNPTWSDASGRGR